MTKKHTITSLLSKLNLKGNWDLIDIETGFVDKAGVWAAKCVANVISYDKMSKLLPIGAKSIDKKNTIITEIASYSIDKLVKNYGHRNKITAQGIVKAIHDKFDFDLIITDISCTSDGCYVSIPELKSEGYSNVIIHYDNDNKIDIQLNLD